MKQDSKESRLNSLLESYWKKVEECEQAKDSLALIKDNIFKELGARSGVLAEDEEFTPIELVCTDKYRTSISNFIQERHFPNWPYIEKTLSARQLKKAMKVRRVASVRFTSKSKKRLVEDNSED